MSILEKEPSDLKPYALNRRGLMRETLQESFIRPSVAFS